MFLLVDGYRRFALAIIYPIRFCKKEIAARLTIKESHTSNRSVQLAIFKENNLNEIIQFRR